MTPEQHRDFLIAFLKELYQIIESAIPDTQDWFEQRKEKVEPHQFAGTVRYRIKMALRALNLEGWKMALKNLSLNGLEIALYRECRKYRIKVYKSFNGLLPGPGDSLNKQHFYEQSCLFPNDPPVMNLVVLWTVDSHYTLVGLHLVRPSRSPKKVGEYKWFIPVPHPATLIQANATATAVDKAADLDSYDDKSDERIGDDDIAEQDGKQDR